MSFRATSELRAQLEDAASKAGHSLTREIERRLELSFQWERAFKDIDAMRAEMKLKMDQITRDYERTSQKRASSKSGFISDENAAAPTLVLTMTEEALSRVVETAVVKAMQGKRQVRK